MAAHREHAAVRAAFEIAVAEAVQTGGDLPTPPAPVSEAHDRALGLLFAEVRSLDEQQGAVLAEIADDVEAALHERVAVTMAEVRGLMPRLDRARRSLVDDLALVRRVRAAADSAAGDLRRPSRADRTPSMLTLDDLADLVEYDGDPLAPAPLPAPQAGVVVRDTDRGLRLGAQSFGQPKEWAPETRVVRLPPGRV